MKKYLSFITLSGLLLLGWLFASDPNDPGSNNLVGVQTSVAELHAPPSNPVLRINLSNPVDMATANRLPNYSLRQTAIHVDSKGGGI